MRDYRPLWGGRGTTVWSLLALVLVLLTGCDEPLQHGLEETDANAMVVALQTAGFEAEKIRDPADAERWAVTVPVSQRVDAWAALQREGFPRPEQGGFGEFYPGGGLIPTATEERIVLQYATARELQSSLLRIDGIVDADVHLVLPEKPRVQMSGTTPPKPRASVLIQWRPRDEAAPIDEESVRELVSGGVENLAPDDVHVVMTQVPKRQVRDEAPEMAQVGPIAVAPSSRGALQTLILSLGGVIIALASGLVFVVFKMRRSKPTGGAG